MTIEAAPNEPTIAELLESARARRGMTRTAAVRHLDTTELTYRNWTRGQIPGLDWVTPIAEFCGVSRYVVLAAMGILSPAEADTLEETFGRDIPGYLPSHRDNAVVPLLQVVA